MNMKCYIICAQNLDLLLKVLTREAFGWILDFPLGSCGDTSYILGAYLHNNGYGVYDYVNGLRNSCSHAWLERSGILLGSKPLKLLLPDAKYSDAVENGEYFYLGDIKVVVSPFITGQGHTQKNYTKRLDIASELICSIN